MLNDTKICKQKLSWSLAPSAPVSFYYKWCNQEILQLQPFKKNKIYTYYYTYYYFFIALQWIGDPLVA